MRALQAAAWLGFSVVTVAAVPTPGRVLVAICVGLFFALAVLVLPGRWTVENDVLLGAKRARFALAQATHASVSRDPNGHAFLRINGRGDQVRIPVTWLPIRIEDFLLDIGLGRTHPSED